MTSTISLFNSANADKCIWSDNEEGQYARKYLTPLMKNGVSKYIANVSTDLQFIKIDNIILPITINDAQYDNSIVCSPYSYYVTFAQDSLPHLSESRLNPIIKPLLSAAGKVLQGTKFNKNVIVNNWLFSTSLYPTLTLKQLEDILNFLTHQFPEHAIIFRSIDPLTNPSCYLNLKQLKFDYIATRQMYFIDPQQSKLFETKLFKSDVKLLNNCGYKVIDQYQIKEQDYPRLLELYRHLSLEKYSRHNPHLTEYFIDVLMKDQLMHFRALKKDGKIDGMVGFVQRHGLMMCPFFGYDRTMPQETALYRLLSTVMMLEAHTKNLKFHLCSGASFFKKIRKAESCIEYMAVYNRHLSYMRQIPWRCLKAATNSLGIKFMKDY